MQASALGNRAACCLPLQQYRECIQDCQAAICLHLQNPTWVQEHSRSSSKDADSTSSRRGSEDEEDSTTTTTSSSSSVLESSRNLDAGSSSNSTSSSSGSKVLHAYVSHELAPLLTSPASTQGNTEAERAAAAAPSITDRSAEGEAEDSENTSKQAVHSSALCSSGISSRELASCAGVPPTAAAATAAFAEALDQQQKSVKSIVRLLGRMALAHAYLKEVKEAEGLYALGEHLAEVAGESNLAGVYSRDRQQLTGL